MLILIILYNWKFVSKCVSCNFSGHSEFWSIFHGRCYAILLYSQMLLPYDIVVDVKTTKDVIASILGMVADVIAMMLMWQMFKPKLIHHIRWQVLLPMWQME